MKYLYFAFLISFLPLQCVQAQAVHQELQEIITAEVLSVIEENERTVPGTETVVSYQTIESLLLDGSKKGETVVFENELTPLDEGDVVYLNYVKTINGDEYFLFKDYKRQNELFLLVGVFIALLVWFARMQGLRALLSLGISIVAILYILIPAILAGYNPALTSLGIAGLILATVLFLTHGVNPRSVIAFLGTFLAVFVTCGLAWFWSNIMHLTGMSSDIAIYLNLSTDGALDFTGLLLAGIIIGILGVLDDVSITQASVVQELKHANASLKGFSLYKRAIKVGKDHVSSLVNTLALAYIGVSLPLVLLFARAESDVLFTLNQEIVAAELVRIIVGSIGLILAVPFTTAIAAWYFGKRAVDEDAISSHGHSHTH